MDEAQVIIKQIHDAFDHAQDELLEEARVFINDHKVDDTKHVKKMADLGFLNAKGVQKAQEKIKASILEAEKAKLVTYYKKTYPFLKFLTLDRLDAICEKYGLIHAPVSHFIEDVPEKNLDEIATAQELKKEDKRPDDVERERQVTIGVKVTRTHMGELFIAAPENHFNLDGLTKKGKKGFFKTTVKIDDPIVFRYVNGGIQVLSKWGLEANDPELANPLDN